MKHIHELCNETHHIGKHTGHRWLEPHCVECGDPVDPKLELVGPTWARKMAMTDADEGLIQSTVGAINARTAMYAADGYDAFDHD